MFVFKKKKDRLRDFQHIYQYRISNTYKCVIFTAIVVQTFQVTAIVVQTIHVTAIVVQMCHNHIGGVMASVLASSPVDRGFEPRSGQTKDYEFGICCFSAKHAALRRKRKDWLARNRDNVSEWGDLYIHGLLFQ